AKSAGASGNVGKGLLPFLCGGGHAPPKGAPGLGKTFLVRTWGAPLQLHFSLIRFPPDLMPADIIGTRVVSQDEEGRRYFEFQQGPIFSNIVLADEVNRATPKTQSALLEAMQEQTVTVAGVGDKLEPPILELATQKPLEMEGRYPLPQAQVDPVFLKMQADYSSLVGLRELVDAPA